MPKKRSKRSIAVSAQVATTKPLPNPRGTKSIRWPSYSYKLSALCDQPSVPTEDEILFRYRGGCPDLVHSPDFRVAATRANVRLWILDGHAHDAEGLSVLKLWLTQVRAESMRVVSSARPSDLAALQKRNPRLRWRRLRKDVSNVVHDRFAIVDEELWHFGATVGGGHLTLNAFSRGFDAVATGMVKFFDTVVWDQWVEQ